MSDELTDYELELLSIDSRFKPRHLAVTWQRALSHAANLLGHSLSYGNACQILGAYTCDTMPDADQLQLFIVTHRFDHPSDVFQD